MSRLVLLGTGGGRFAAILQARATGGVHLLLDDPDGRPRRFQIDPGPGALVRMLERGIDPLRTDAILVSHCHPDHYTDAEMLIEGMTNGGNDRTGALLASRSVIEGVEGFGPAISKYHAAMPGLARVVSPGDRIDVAGIRVDATPSVHSDPSSVGFRVHAREGVIGYVSDTALAREVTEAHLGSRILILPVTRPLKMPIPHHLTVEDAASMIEAVRPELALLTHFGMRVIKDGPDAAAAWIQERTGVRTMAGKDGMAVEMGKELTMR
ncbi:MAG: MBL fold metallo-hydrolase [Euryarchaeota archaeon]|nr:MBL fold metallo-hydrolase [Euryarchaeota archaeon]